MSAIAGVLKFENYSVNPDDGRRLMEHLNIYPSDDVQIWQRNHIFLGCHAQWITPESIEEKNPYYDSERGLVITSDAIIDNRKQLFEALQIPIHMQKGIPDSQLILLAYAKWGEETPLYLIGDFAFMIWDEKEQTLFGARDFSGSRTLYYCHNHEQFSFCTVINPLFSLSNVSRSINEEWIAQFLAIPGMVDAVEAELTAYRDIKQIPPSTTITVRNGHMNLKQYKAINLNKEIKLKSNDEYVEAFQAIFETAVTDRLRTHREVGARLSGGLDSGSVVSFAAPLLKQQNKQLKSFSYIPVSDFEDWAPKSRMANEKPYIQATVKHVGNIAEHYLDFSGESSYSEMDEILSIYEMPYKFYENSFWVKGIYEAAMQQNVGVILSGGRGNYSISWGPALDYYAQLMKRLNWWRLAKEIPLYSKNRGIGKKRMLGIISQKAFPSIFKSAAAHEYKWPQLVHSSLAEKTNVFSKLEQYGVTEATSMYDARSKQFEQLFHWNKNGMSSTKMSLRYNAWNRDPTNDLRIIQYCMSIPEEQFIQNGMDRALIRRATKNYLPDKVRLNYKIRGFQGADIVHRMLPEWSFIMNDVAQLLSDPIIENIINKEVVQQAVTKLRYPLPNQALDSDMKVIMRSIIVYKFMKSAFEGR